jgi:NAD(P)-dependent dehydrogenase (short-subunit alcohol dehydrogenase family)
MQLKDQAAIVTGGASGLGAAIVQASSLRMAPR